MNIHGSITIVALMLTVVAFWDLASNAIAFRQRSALIDFVFSHRDWAGLRDELDRVAYLRHHRAVFFGRDPRALYAPALRPGFDWPQLHDEGE